VAEQQSANDLFLKQVLVEKHLKCGVVGPRIPTKWCFIGNVDARTAKEYADVTKLRFNLST